MTCGPCPHCGEPLESHGAACRPEAFRRVLTGPPRVYSSGYSWHPRPRDPEREAQQAEARALLTEWRADCRPSPEMCQRIRALLTRIAGGEG